MGSVVEFLAKIDGVKIDGINGGKESSFAVG